MNKNQCEYCCWYVPDYDSGLGRCDAPYQMRKSACEDALRLKCREDRVRNNKNIE